MVWGSTKLYGTKIKTLDNGVVLACAGKVADEARAQRYFSKPMTNDPPKVDKSFQCIVIVKGEPFFCHENLIPIPIEHPFFAVGSGADFALMAMQMGCSAIEAIIRTSELDANTNNETTYVELHAKKKATKP